jgi:hypothetical protein
MYTQDINTSSVGTETENEINRLQNGISTMKMYQIVFDSEFGLFFDKNTRANFEPLTANFTNEREAIEKAKELISEAVTKGSLGKGNNKKYPIVGALVVGFETSDKVSLRGILISEFTYVVRTDISVENGFAMLNLSPNLTVEDIKILKEIYDESQQNSQKVQVQEKNKGEIKYYLNYIQEKAKHILTKLTGNSTTQQNTDKTQNTNATQGNTSQSTNTTMPNFDIQVPPPKLPTKNQTGGEKYDKDTYKRKKAEYEKLKKILQ